MSATAVQKERWNKLVYSGLGAAILAAIVLTLNFMLGYVPLRLDTSEGKLYSLSPGSKTILKDLDDNLVVKVIFTRDLPPPYGLNEKYVHDLLAEYRRASHGRIKLEFIDPASSDRIKAEIMGYGIQPVQLDVREKDRRELKECYMGMIFLYHSEHEAIPFIQNPQTLEYEITQRIKKMIHPIKPKIGVANTAGSLLMSGDELKTINTYASQIYEFQEVDLSSAVPANLKALWLIGPTQRLDTKAIANLKAWVEDGNILGLLIDWYTVRIEQFQPTTIDTGLGDLLKGWGVNFKQGLIFDPQSDRIQLRSQQGYYQMVNVIDYPYFPLVSDLNRENPATKDLDAISLPFVSPLLVENPPAGLTYTPLARTSARSWLNTLPYNVSPVSRMDRPKEVQNGPFNVGLLVEGKFKQGDPSAKTGRLIVFGCSRFVRSDYPLRATNYATFLNLLDWSAQDEILLSIRSKGSTRRPLKEMSTGRRLLVKTVLIFFLPIMVLVAGLLVWMNQRMRRAALTAAYQGS